MPKHYNPKLTWDTYEGEVMLEKEEKPLSQAQEASYIVCIGRDGYFKAKNCRTGHVEFRDRDAGTVIQSAINALTNGGKIFIKEGTYPGTFGIAGKYGITIEGVYGRTILKNNLSAGVTLKIGLEGDTAIKQGNIVIRNIVIDGGYPDISDGAGIDVNAAENVFIENVIFQNCGSRALRVCVWTTSQASSKNIHARNCVFDKTAVVLGGIDGGSIKNCRFFGNTISPLNSVIDLSYGEAGVAALVQNFTIEDNLFEDIQPSQIFTGAIVGFQYVKNVSIVNNRIINVKAGAIIERSPPSDEILENVQILNNKIESVATGITVRRSIIEGNHIKDVIYGGIYARSGNRIFNNVIENTNILNDTIYFDKGCIYVDTCDDVWIIGNVFKDSQSTPTTPYGVALNNSTNILIQLNQFKGPFTVTPIKFYGTNADLSIKRNIGYVTENSGTATITAGSTYVDVTHGLSVTPDINKIKITPKDNLGGRSFWVSNVTSTTFGINISSTDTVDHELGWSYEE
jgi:hypothetical protein